MSYYFDSDTFESLSRMAEEYNRLVQPFVDQLQIYNRWQEVTSPLLRVVSMNHDVLSGINAFDSSVADRLREITEPFQPMLDNMMAMETLMGTQFSELVKPQVYIPSYSDLHQLGQVAVEAAQVGRYAQIANRETKLIANVAEIAQLGQATAEVIKASELAGIAQAASGVAQLVKPWQTELATISAFKTSITDSGFSRLVELEKEVAGLSPIMEQYDQMTSISVQIASIAQIGLTDSWKRAITPPDLLRGLNDFAIKQYEQIEKASDEHTIAWRLGLVDIASRYVDAQVAWGTALALESDEEAPEIEISSPDFSELPKFFGAAKRNNRDVEEAYDESQIKIITDTGRLIIQKAKVINDCCRIRQRELLFSEADIINGAMILGGAFCRESDALNEVMATVFNMFVRRPVIDLIGHQECFDTIDKYRTETKKTKSAITKLQKDIYNEILRIEDSIIESFGELKANILDEDPLCSNVYSALLHVQGNRIYQGVNENAINDGLRDQLKMLYDVKDQTRQGDSPSGKDAGEIDLLICDSGRPWAIIEGLKLNSVNKDYLDTHINKALTNYDPFGCPIVYILVFAVVKKFEDFWDKLVEYIKEYTFPYEVIENFRDINTAYTESRHGKSVLRRNGKNISVHLYAIAMR